MSNHIIILIIINIITIILFNSNFINMQVMLSDGYNSNEPSSHALIGARSDSMCRCQASPSSSSSPSSRRRNRRKVVSLRL